MKAGGWQPPLLLEKAFERLASELMSFCEDYSPYFRAARHDLSGKARTYLGGLLMKAERKNMERMEEYVPDYDYQGQQQFLSDSPWDHETLLKRVGQDVDELLGGSDSMLLIDESGFAKKGVNSVGAARQWNGRMGKVDNCQVGVFAALSDGRNCAPVDARPDLPQAWAENPERCPKAKIPEDKRTHKTKPELAWEMVEAALEGGMRFGWVSLDSLYGNARLDDSEPPFRTFGLFTLEDDLVAEDSLVLSGDNLLPKWCNSGIRLADSEAANKRRSQLDAAARRMRGLEETPEVMHYSSTGKLQRPQWPRTPVGKKMTRYKVGQWLGR